MIRWYCDNSNWDVFIPFLLFAVSVRDTLSSSTNYTPFQLVYTHEVRTPLKISLLRKSCMKTKVKR